MIDDTEGTHQTGTIIAGEKDHFQNGSILRILPSGS